MSADPYIQAPSDLQSFNRYGYVRNNPLNKTDPSGYSWWTKLRDKFIKPMIAAYLDIYCGGCATILLNAYNASQVKDANGHRLGWKGAFFSVGISLLGGASDNSIYQSGVNALSGCGMSAMAGGSCKKGAVEAVTNDIAGPVIGGCINASRAGQSCAVGAREGATSALGGWAARETAGAAHNYLNSRGSGSGSGSGGSSGGGGGGDDETVLLAQASQAGRIGMGNQAGNAGIIYDNGMPVGTPSFEIPRWNAPSSFDIRSLIPLPIRIGWEWMMSVSGVDQPREPDLVIVPEKDGNKIAQESGWNNAHEAKKGRGESKVNIYDDKKTGRKWLWNGKKGSGKEEL